MPETTANFVAPDFLALTIGIVVFFVGVLITQRVSFLRTYNIPEPVTGGFVAALAFWAVYEVFGLEIGFDMTTRDRLLVIFFATVGVNARLADLAAGGRVLGDALPGHRRLRLPAGQRRHNRGGGVRPADVGGGGGRLGLACRRARHRNRLGADHRRGARLSRRAGEGIAVATLGLIIASLLGGPIAKLLIERHGLAPSPGRSAARASCRRRLTQRRSTRWGSCARCSPSTSRSSSAIWCTAWLTSASGDQAAALRALPDHGHPAVEHGAARSSRASTGPRAPPRSS